MSAGSARSPGSVDFEESNPEVAPAGTSRFYRAGGITRLSADGQAGGAIWSLPAQRMTDANTTIALADGKSVYYYPTSILSANRTLTISAAGAPALGWQVSIAVFAAQGFDVIVNDDAATLLHTIPAGRKAVFNTYFNSATSHAITGNWYFLP